MLENSKLLLRALEPEDIELLYQWENDTQLWHISNTVKPFSRYELEQYVLNSHLDIFEHKQLRLMIESKEKDKNVTVGCIDLFDFDPINLKAGVGLYIKESYRRKGLATDALNLLILYVRNKLHLHQLYCSITPDNEASIKVFNKSGFILSGKHLQWIRKEDEWLDENFYQLILEKV